MQTAGGQELQGGDGNDGIVGRQGADTLSGGAGDDYFGFGLEDFEAGVWDVIADMNAGGIADWFTTSGIARADIRALEHQGGVIVSTAALGFGPSGGGVFIESFAAAQFWDQLCTL